MALSNKRRSQKHGGFYVTGGYLGDKARFPLGEFVRATRKQEFSNVIGWRKSSLLRQPITLPDFCFRVASREQIRLVENGLKVWRARRDKNTSFII